MVFEWILGQWLFERTVTPHASASGKAEITRISQDEAVYSEHARVTLAAGEVLSGTQSYLYRRRDRGFDILFSATGLLFQSLEFRYDGAKLAATAAHDCVHDTYSSEYVLFPENRMFVRHMVRGPMKDYVSTTAFQRVA